MDKRRNLIVAAVVALAALAAVVRGFHRSDGGPPVVRVASTEAKAARTVERPAPASSGLVVYVAGEVRRPGVYDVPSGARVTTALRAAGGVTPAADPVAVNFAERLRDGEEVVVPARGVAGSSAAKRTRGHSRRGQRRSHKAPPPAPVDVNAADAATLETIPGIGPRLAARIVEFREQNGGFAAPEDLLDVNGVSDKLLAAIEPYLSFSAH